MLQFRLAGIDKMMFGGEPDERILQAAQRIEPLPSPTRGEPERIVVILFEALAGAEHFAKECLEKTRSDRTGVARFGDLLHHGGGAIQFAASGGKGKVSLMSSVCQAKAGLTTPGHFPNHPSRASPSS